MAESWENQPRVPAGNPEGGQWTGAVNAARKAAGLDNDNGIKKFLGDVAKMAGEKSIEHYILEHGKGYKPVEHDYEKGYSKECFMNAFRFVQSNPDYTYVEVYATPDFIDLPMLHAWVTDKQGKAFELTWEKSGSAYFGVEIPYKKLLEIAVETEVYGVFGTLGQYWREVLED